MNDDNDESDGDDGAGDENDKNNYHIQSVYHALGPAVSICISHLMSPILLSKVITMHKQQRYINAKPRRA